MPATITQCPQGHDIRSAADRDTQGHCRECGRERTRRKRVSDSMRLAMVRAFEEAGVRFEDDYGQPVAPADVVAQLAQLYETGAF